MSGAAPKTVERLRATPPRSWLFVPALKAREWLPKAIATGADAVIIDLEDATAPSEKDKAREVVRGLALTSGDGPFIAVRVNGPPPAVEDDCAAAVAAGADAVILPKVEGEYQVRRACGLLEGSDLAVLPMIETARAVLKAMDLAEADERVGGLMFGGGDLAAEVGWVRTREGDELATARSMVAMAAAARGINAVDTPWLDIKDTSGARTDAEVARRFGFTGKFAIHPSHVSAIHQAFAPSEAEVADARGLIEAFEKAVAAGAGVATYKGRMIDKPDALQAKRVLARADLASKA